MNINNKILNNTKPDKTLHRMRFCAQIAERAGYTIAGVTAAYDISGVLGIISFGLCMLLFANLQSKLIFTWRLSLGSPTLRTSLILRALSFIALALGVMNASIGFMLIGASLSGLFVGLFWPTFYTMKQEGIGRWFAVEKTTGVLLTVSTGVLLLYANLLWILGLSLFATLLSLACTFRISAELFDQHFDQSISQIDLSKPRKIAFLDGAIGESLRMIRRLALLTGTVTFLGLEGVLSFALVLGISEAGGAILTRMKRIEPMHFASLGFLGSFVCILGAEYWLYGLLLLGMSLSGLFPVLQNEVRNLLDNANVIDLNFRERNRSEGRVAGAVFSAGVFLLQIPLEFVFFGIVLALLALIRYSSHMALPKTSKKEVTAGAWALLSQSHIGEISLSECKS